jgi:hyperosmotically inducible protein
MTFLKPTHTALIVSGMTALAVLAACTKASEAPVTLALPSNNITLGSQVDDAVVTSSVKKALLTDLTINSFDLHVGTRNGVVQLSGFVDDQAQIAMALALAHAVPGVKTVENGLSLKGSTSTLGTKIDDATVTGRVKGALLTDPDIRSFDISVVTFKGEVQLSGFVNNQRQIDLAARIASATEGATNVKNELMLKQ